MIDIENAGSGKGHFSQMTLDRFGIRTLDLNELNEDDIILLNFFGDSLNDVIYKIDNDRDAINEAYRAQLISAHAILSRKGSTPTQHVFRDYLKNKFGGLLGYVQVYTQAVAKGDEEGMDFARQGLRAMYDTYFAIL